MVEINYMHIDLVRELVAAHRQIRKLQRALRKAAGREKRLKKFNKLGFGSEIYGAKLILLEDGNVTEYQLCRWAIDSEIANASGRLTQQTTITARVGYDVPDDHEQCKCVVENVNL